MNMQALDIREKNSNKMQDASFKKKLASCILHLATLVTCRLPLVTVLILITCYSLPVTVVYAQQPAGQRTLEEERLNIIRADIQKKIEQLEKLKKEIEEAQKVLQKERDEEILKVVKIYEAMPPERAARKLEALNENTAALILTHIKPRTAGRIMAQMNTEKAASISKKMLERGKVVTEKTSQ